MRNLESQSAHDAAEMTGLEGLDDSFDHGFGGGRSRGLGGALLLELAGSALASLDGSRGGLSRSGRVVARSG